MSRDTDLSNLMDAIVVEWRPFVHSSTPHAVEIMALWAAHTHLLNIPDPKGPEITAAKEWHQRKGQLKKDGLKGDVLAEALGPEPVIPDDPRERVPKDELGLYTSPLLTINADGPARGKSNVLQVLEALTFSAWPLTSVPTVASVRDILSGGGTLLVDEAQRTFYFNAPDGREAEALLNASFSLSAGAVSKMVQDAVSKNFEPRYYPVFAGLALAGINLRFSGDVETRMIWINLTPGSTAKWDDRTSTRPFYPFGQQLKDLLRSRKAEAYRHARNMPVELVGRSGDRWRPLIITADLIGGRWPGLARKIAVEAIRNEQEESRDDIPEQAMLYRDCVSKFAPGVEFIESATLLGRLQADDDTRGTWGQIAGATWIKSATALFYRLKSPNFRAAKPKQSRDRRSRGYYNTDFGPGLEYYKEDLLGHLSEVSEVSGSAESRGSSDMEKCPPWTLQGVQTKEKCPPKQARDHAEVDTSDTLDTSSEGVPEQTSIMDLLDPETEAS